MTKNNNQIGRLAFRSEGGSWNAYYALPNTMEGAVLVGSIKMGAVLGRPDLRELFINLMCDVIADIIFDETGERPDFEGIVAAPWHERCGHA